ncbi:MAG: ATP-dependent DNA helicase, partial [Halobacteriales archaeon]|nr:ATP-dependent DNA helicase [Halobacteriales archaeon]
MASDSGTTGADSDPWRELFGFETPYDNQADAIETAIDVGRERGFLVMEGPCGTGKTMAALTAGATLVRHTDRYENIVVITPVKQQLQQFVADLRTMNAGLDAPLTGIALVGKTDLCPYGREDVFPEDVGTHDRCEDLREHTADLVEAESDRTGTPEAVGSVAVQARRNADEEWWDPQRASTLARAAHRDSDEFRTQVPERLTTAGADSPYVRHQPSAPEDMTAAGEPPLYCPFEADWYARNKGSPVGFDAGEHWVITSDEFLPTAVEYGTCPHRVMGVLLEEADVVIGNYNHLFDARTRELTEAILDEETFVIVDEAHRLEGRVRELLSETIGRQSLQQARNDLDRLLQYANQSRENRDQATDRLDDYDVPIEVVERTRTFYSELIEWLEDYIESYLTDEYAEYDRTFGHTALSKDDIEIPLREPTESEPDALTDWLSDAGYRDTFCRQLGTIGGAVEQTLEAVDPDRTCICGAVGTLIGQWIERDHTDYFREITLEHSPKDREDPEYAWERVYTPGLVMYNCMPGEQLRAIFEQLGGGILMSATLEPLDVLEEVVGLESLADTDTDTTTTGTAAEDRRPNRPVVERTYDLPFPEDNRASWIVDATPFTMRNRGEPTPENRNDTREEYAYVLRLIARSPGNVLLAMPNYREAAWAADRLTDAIDKPVLLDEPSSSEATDTLKAEFFAGEGKVLATSTRGTLTEGIDYDGAKLRTCAVVGIPLVNIGSPRVQAVKHAYGEAFGSTNAFEYALTIPAVRRARQAIGRVIRGPEERGARILVDHRYTQDATRNSVYDYLAPMEREEFVRMTPMFIESQLEQFW